MNNEMQKLDCSKIYFLLQPSPKGKEPKCQDYYPSGLGLAPGNETTAAMAPTFTGFLLFGGGSSAIGSVTASHTLGFKWVFEQNPWLPGQALGINIKEFTILTIKKYKIIGST